MLTIKNWSDFQHYKDRSPPWIKLHKNLLDDYDFQCLPLASRALAPMLWLLASENMAGEIDSAPKRLAFRLRWSEKEVVDGLKPLLAAGFVIDASAALAGCLQDACPETEAYKPETEAYKPEAEKKAHVADKPQRFNVGEHLAAKLVSESLAADWVTLRKAKKAPPTLAAVSGIEREAAAAGMTLAEALEICCQRGWAGFKAEWVSAGKRSPRDDRAAKRQEVVDILTGRAPRVIKDVFSGNTIEGELS
jgi:hypothetical protein